MVVRDAKLAERANTGLNARVRRTAEWRLRLATSRWRRLPDFIIIGGQRCGTTSLFHSLAEHPRLVPSFRKEVHYFDFHQRKHGLDWYRANFPMRTRRSGHYPTFEATPNYLAFPGAPQSIPAAVPDTKLIALLRNPIERAHSSWRFTAYQGLENRDFGEAVRAEARRDAESDGAETTEMRHAYLAKSRYAEHLEKWMELFDPERLLVVRSEDLFNEPDDTISRILGFVDPDLRTDLRIQHIHASPTADIEPGLRDWLAEYFEPHNRKLAALTGLEFTWS